MSTTKHTQGQWSDDQLTRFDETIIRGGKLRLITADDGVIVAFVPGWVDVPEEASEARANAQLIAAAPELLQALQALVFEYAPNFKSFALNSPRKAMWERARAAIAKATGGAA